MDGLAAREAAFRAWRCAPVGELLGSGKYGSVFACGAGAAAKVMDLSGKSRHARMQAYREHVVSIMQTLLLLHGATPHFPFHYGLTVAVAELGMSLTLFMERFDGNLLEKAAAALGDAAGWVHLAFQLLHGCLCLAAVFGVVHNDLYPRNVLLRAVRTGAAPSPADLDDYDRLVADWSVSPALAARIADDLAQARGRA